jgi:cytochrome b561
MNNKSPGKHHGAIIVLHWLTALLVAASFVIALARNGMEDSDARLFWLDVHRSLGLLVLLLVVVRAGVRAMWGREPVNAMPRNLRVLSWFGHVALYVSMLALPLLGWAQSSARARARHFRLFEVAIPSLLAHDPDRADLLGSWHSLLAWSFLALIGAHAAAALWHHYGRRDGVLLSMLPFVRPHGSPSARNRRATGV